MNDLRLGGIGLGVRSDLVDLAHRLGSGSRPVACCDRDPVHLDKARDRFGPGVLAVTDHRDPLRSGLDGVFILTPDHTHEAIGLDFLRAGVPVFLDKTLALQGLARRPAEQHRPPAAERST